MNRPFLIKFLIGGFLLAVIVTFFLSPHIISAPKNWLSAAIGTIDTVTLRAWQRMGGFGRTLTGGSVGTDVRLIQNALATDPILYPEGVVSGYFGPLTKRAVERFQTENGLLQTGVFGSQTQVVLNRIFYGQLCPTSNYPDIDLSHTSITRQNGLPQAYVPPNLTDISTILPTTGVVCVTKPTADALTSLMRAAKEDRMTLVICSGYRGPVIQRYLFQSYIFSGIGSAFDTAEPGHSEHQLGTVVDFTAASVGYACATNAFESTPEFIWLREHAYIYGFNMSYQKTQIEYAYEPWHYRYFGTTTQIISYEDY